MATFTITLPEGVTLTQGKQITFTAPADSNGITGIIIDSITYTLLKANGDSLETGAFINGALVSVLIDLTNHKAYIQNAASITNIAHKATHSIGGADALIDADIGLTPAVTTALGLDSIDGGLLHNADFRNPLNSNGQTVYSGGIIPCIDNWSLFQINTVFTVNSGYITVAGSGGMGQIAQPVANPSTLFGKIATLSIKLRGDTTIYSNSGVVSSITGTTSLSFTPKADVYVFLWTADGYLTAIIQTGDGSSVDVEAAKLELGSVSTLEEPLNSQVKDALAKLSGAALRVTDYDGVTQYEGLVASVPENSKTGFAYDGGSTFVLVGHNTTPAPRIAYSTNLGATFNTATIPAAVTTNSLYSVAYGGGKFVAMPNSSNVGCYSLNGIDWTAFTMPVSGVFQSIAYDKVIGKFVAVGTNSNTGVYSSDGINWTSFTIPAAATQSWRVASNEEGLFVAVSGGASSNTTAYSTNGINWTQGALPSHAIWNFISFSNGEFFAGSANALLARSTNGVDWTSVSLPSAIVAVPQAIQLFFENTSGYYFLRQSGSSTFYISKDLVNWKVQGGFGAVYADRQAFNIGESLYICGGGNVNGYVAKLTFIKSNSLTDMLGGDFPLPYAKIATGSYTGTGTHGSANPNILPLPFTPKVFIVAKVHTFYIDSYDTGYVLSPAIMPEGVTSVPVYGLDYQSGSSSQSSFVVNFSKTTNGISWSANSAHYQQNISGKTYLYLAMA